MNTWQKQIDDLPIPYPEKHQLMNEIVDHVQHIRNDESRFEGFKLDALDELVSVHNSQVLLGLRRLPMPVRNAIELSFIVGPLTGLLIYLIKEDFMFNAIHEGGAAMYAILAIGGFMLLREALLFFRVNLLRDHTKENLNLDSNSVLVGTLALIVVGICATGLGAYISIDRAASTADINYSFIVLGMKESITNIIVSTMFAALVLILHYTTRKLCQRWQAPIS